MYLYSRRRRLNPAQVRKAAATALKQVDPDAAVRAKIK